MGYESLSFLKEGDMFLLDAKVNDTTKPYFFIKDCISNLRKIGDSPIIECKGIVFETCSEKVVLLIMVRFNKDDSLIFCQWYNQYDKLYREKLDKLIFSDKLNFCTVNSGNKKYATFECDNSLRFLLSSSLKGRKHFTMSNEEFKDYVYNISKGYNSRVSLFNEAKYHGM